METKNENIQVCMAVPAGFTLAQELKSRQISQREFAKTIEMQATHLNEILKGKRNITPAIALKLENALGSMFPMRLRRAWSWRSLTATGVLLLIWIR